MGITFKLSAAPGGAFTVTFPICLGQKITCKDDLDGCIIVGLHYGSFSGPHTLQNKYSRFNDLLRELAGYAARGVPPSFHYPTLVMNEVWQ